MHAKTGKNLHSHAYDAALSGQQEVSGFGENGRGDTGDKWVVVCLGAGAAQWRRLEPVNLRHVDTGAFLSTSRAHEFNDGNCANWCVRMRGRRRPGLAATLTLRWLARCSPIVGQLEASAVPRAGAGEVWRVELGIVF